MSTPTLGADAVVDYLRGLGLLAPGPVDVRELTGGVSGIVLEVAAADQRLVVKQPLAQLGVAQGWTAGQERSVTEAKALVLAARWTPGHVPAVVAVDSDRFILVMARAPEAMRSWKSQLLAGHCDSDVAATLGRVLGRWHRRSHLEPDTIVGLAAPGALEDLRVSPYYRATANAFPDAAHRISTLIDLLETRRHCLVHGDFSPKNVLVGGGQVWVLDFEVAHVGDPDFDVAFLLTHLIAKAVHRPQCRPKLARCAAMFIAAYEAEIATCSLSTLPSTAAAHTGGLLLARVHGKSPLEYLDSNSRSRVTAAGLAALANPSATRAEVWDVALDGVHT